MSFWSSSARRASAALGLFVVVGSASLGAGRAEAQADAPRRPRLAASADTNDWEAYYDRGAEQIASAPTQAGDAFYWAARLNPGRAEPLFGMWAAYWTSVPGDFERYIQDDPRVLERPKTKWADSVRYLALHRNPFVFQGFELLPIDKLPGRWSASQETRAWLAYAKGNFPTAAKLFGDAARRSRGVERERHRYHRTLALVAGRQYDSAMVEMTALVEEARQRDASRVVPAYESKAMYEYALGLLFMARGDLAQAKARYAHALEEELSFAPAHDALSQVAYAQGDSATAVNESRQAVELSPEDPLYRQRYGWALLLAGRSADALEQYRKGIALEPYFADNYYGLAAAQDLLGDRAAALAGYRDYLSRAARRASPMRQRAEARVAALGMP